MSRRTSTMCSTREAGRPPQPVCRTRNCLPPTRGVYWAVRRNNTTSCRINFPEEESAPRGSHGKSADAEFFPRKNSDFSISNTPPQIFPARRGFKPPACAPPKMRPARGKLTFFPLGTPPRQNFSALRGRTGARQEGHTLQARAAATFTPDRKMLLFYRAKPQNASVLPGAAPNRVGFTGRSPEKRRFDWAKPPQNEQNPPLAIARRYGLDNAAWGSHVFTSSAAQGAFLGRPTLTKFALPDWRPRAFVW